MFNKRDEATITNKWRIPSVEHVYLHRFNHADDDSYIEDESHRRDYLLSDVGVIWRGTSRHKVPLTWEFGQVGVC